MDSKQILNVNSDTTLSWNHNQIYVDATSNNITLTLPDVTGIGDGFEFIIQRYDSVTSKIVTVTPVNATIDGASSMKLGIKQNLKIVYTNGVWRSDGNFGRITQRVVITTQSATPNINTDNTDVASITGLNQDITSFTTNLSGTPMAGDLLEIQITDNGVERLITWGASFASSTVTLPNKTIASTMLRVFLEWNSSNNKWDCIGTTGTTSQVGSFGVTYNGMGGVISVNNYIRVIVPYNCTITNWIVSSINPLDGSSVSGSIVVDIKRNGTSIIGAGNKPTLASQSDSSAAAAAWTSVSVSANDKLDFYVVSCATCLEVNCSIIANKT